MFNFRKRVLAFLLMLTFIVAPFSNISLATKNEVTVGNVKELTISRNEAVIGNVITFDYLSEKVSDIKLVYLAPSGEEVEIALEFDEDMGMYTNSFIPKESGDWVNSKILVDNKEVSPEKYDLNFTIYESVEDQYGRKGPFVYDDAFQNDAKVVIEDLDEIISQVYGISEEGSTTDIAVRIQGEGLEEELNLYNDGSSFITDENFSKFKPGNYTLTYSISGGENVVKNITIVADVADSNYVRLAAEEVSLSAQKELTRIAGKNRYETSVEVSKRTYDKAESVVIANGTTFPDALASTAFSYNQKAPLLYAYGNSLNAKVKAEIKRLGAKTAYLIGGNSVVTPKVEAELKREGLNVVRIAGVNRFYTATAVANKLREKNKQTTAIITNNDSYADALSAGSYSAQKGFPLLYTTKNSLQGITKKFLDGADIKKVIIVGGESVVTNNVVKDITAMNIDVERIAGSNRYMTSLEFSKKFYDNPTSVVMASGNDFADALAGGGFAATKNAPVVLANSKFSEEGKKYISGSSVDNVYILGGENALNGSIFSGLSTGESPTPTPQPAPQQPVQPVQEPTPSPNTSKKVKIMLDPGHGGGSQHNRGFIGGNEGDSNYAYALILKEELERRGFYVGMTKSSRWDDPSLAARGQAAKGYDLFLSLHTNATGTSSKASGAEIYDDTNPYYSNKALADKLGKAIANAQGIRYRGTFYRKLSNGTNFYGVLRNNEAKNGFLVEHCFHDNASEVANFVKNYRKVAVASADTLAAYYGMK